MFMKIFSRKIFPVVISQKGVVKKGTSTRKDLSTLNTLRKRGKACECALFVGTSKSFTDYPVATVSLRNQRKFLENQ